MDQSLRLFLANRARSNEHSPSDASALYGLLIESVVDYAIFVLDREGVVQSWNPGAARLKGYTADEIIGRYFGVFYPPEDVERGKPAAVLAAAASSGRAEDEGWRMRKDGSRFWANVVVTALHDDAGEVIGFAKVTRDLTNRRASEERARELAASQAARAAAERLNVELEQQKAELQAQTDEAQSLTEELEETNDALQSALLDAEESRDDAQRAERFARGVVSSITDPFVVYDAEWRFEFINEPASALLDPSRAASPDARLGQTLWDAYPNIRGTTFEREMRRAMDDRTTVSFEAYNAESGQWTQAFCYPMPGGGLSVQWKNVTERMQAEEATHYLARATEVLASSLDYEKTLDELARLVVPELADWCGVDVVDDSGVVRQIGVSHVDPAKVRFARELSERYPPDHNAPTGAPNVMRTGRPEMYPDISDEMLAAGAVDAEHLRIIRELGLRSAIIVPLKARDRIHGTLTLVSAESGRRYNERDLALAVELGRRAGIAVDNARLYADAQTARTDAERARARAEAARDEAELANRAKSDFLAHMSHELRTPLNAIAGYAELIDIGIHGPVTPAQHDALQRVRLAQRRLLALVNDVLNFARVESGRMDYVLQPLLLRDVVHGVLPMVETQLAAKHIQLEVRVDDADGSSPIRATADREKLEQILLNLLSNATKFTAAEGRVTIDVSRLETERGERAQIAVSDTGTGIPPDKLDAIFEPFVQVRRTAVAEAEGTGLGLAISRDLARGMGGDITAKSTLGAGSTFALTLPLA